MANNTTPSSSNPFKVLSDDEMEMETPLQPLKWTSVEEVQVIEEGEIVAESNTKEGRGEVTPPKTAPAPDFPSSIRGSLLKDSERVITRNMSQNLSWADECSSPETDPSKKKASQTRGDREKEKQN